MSNPYTERSNPYPYQQLTFEDTENANEVNELYKATYEYLYGNKNKTDNYEVELHKQICNKLNEIYEKKNTDYGNSFHKTVLEEGFAVCRIRLTDKLERFKHLSKTSNNLVQDESIQDTLLDLANYAIMTYMEIENYKQNKKEKSNGK